MSYILTFVDQNVTPEFIEEVFCDTFGVIPSVKMSPIKNRQGQTYRTATLTFESQPSDLKRWLKVVNDTGMNSICYKTKSYWTVRPVSTEVAIAITPRITF